MSELQKVDPNFVNDPVYLEWRSRFNGKRWNLHSSEPEYRDNIPLPEWWSRIHDAATLEQPAPYRDAPADKPSTPNPTPAPATDQMTFGGLFAACAIGVLWYLATHLFRNSLHLVAPFALVSALVVLFLVLRYIDKH